MTMRGLHLPLVTNQHPSSPRQQAVLVLLNHIRYKTLFSPGIILANKPSHHLTLGYQPSPFSGLSREQPIDLAYHHSMPTFSIVPLTHVLDLLALKQHHQEAWDPWDKPGDDKQSIAKANHPPSFFPLFFPYHRAMRGHSLKQSVQRLILSNN